MVESSIARNSFVRAELCPESIVKVKLSYAPYTNAVPRYSIVTYSIAMGSYSDVM